MPLEAEYRSRARLSCGFDQLVDHVLGRGKIGIAHPEIDDVGASVASGGLDSVHLFEDVGRQSLDAMEIRHEPILEKTTRKTDPRQRGRGLFSTIATKRAKAEAYSIRRISHSMTAE